MARPKKPTKPQVKKQPRGGQTGMDKHFPEGYVSKSERKAYARNTRYGLTGAGQEKDPHHEVKHILRRFDNPADVKRNLKRDIKKPQFTPAAKAKQHKTDF